MTSKSPKANKERGLLAPALTLIAVSVIGITTGLWRVVKIGPDPSDLLALSFSWLNFGIGMIAVHVTRKKPLSEEAYSFFDFRPLQIHKINGESVQGRHAGVALIISEKTVRFLYMERFPEDTQLTLELDLPMSVINIEGKVTRSRPYFSKGALPLFEIDVSYVSLNEKAALDLIRYFFEDATPRTFAGESKALDTRPRFASKNQRGQRRAPSMLPVFVHSRHLHGADTAIDSFMGMLVDLSTTGACVQLPFSAAIGEELEIQVPWAKSSLKAKVVRCMKEADSVNPSYEIGLTFETKLELTTHEKLMLRKHLSRVSTGARAA